MNKRFKFGDKVWSVWTGNAIFYKYRIADPDFPEYNTEVFIDNQNETCSIEANELRKGWKQV